MPRLTVPWDSDSFEDMSRPPLPIPKDLRTVARLFADAGYQCWLVGGAVRDGLLGRGSEDFDLATDARPEEVKALFRRTVPTGVRHGTVTILLGTHQFETTTFRRDGRYTDGRRPDAVAFADNIEEDLARRDFTVNAIAWDLVNRRLEDPHDGRGDLKRRIIRAIGVPDDRFEEDALRPIRACRFAAQLGFAVDEATESAISRRLDGVPALSVERIWEELKKILTSPRPSTAFHLFRRTGLLDIILPELAAGIGVEQKGRHTLDVFDHSLAACDAAPADSLAVRAAALLHDVGKPDCRAVDGNGEIIFHRHDLVGEEMTRSVLDRYKASNAEKDRIVRLVRHHMFHYTPDWSDAAVRRFIVRVGSDILDDLVALRLADSAAIAPGRAVPTGYLEEFISRIDGILAGESALSIRDLALNGRDLMTELNLSPGPKLGTLLEHLLDCVLEDPGLNERERLLDLARRWLDVYS